MQTFGMQRRQNCAWCKTVLTGLYFHAFDMGRHCYRRKAGRNQLQHRHLRRFEQHSGKRHSTSGIDHHAHRVGTFDMAHRQLRLIGNGRAGTDHNRIDQGPQAVQMLSGFKPVDVMRISRRRGNAAVEALAQLGQAKWQRGGGNRQQQIQPITIGLGQYPVRPPAALAYHKLDTIDIPRQLRITRPIMTGGRQQDRPDGLGQFSHSIVSRC